MLRMRKGVDGMIRVLVGVDGAVGLRDNRVDILEVRGDSVRDLVTELHIDWERELVAFMLVGGEYKYYNRDMVEFIGIKLPHSDEDYLSPEVVRSLITIEYNSDYTCISEGKDSVLYEAMRLEEQIRQGLVITIDKTDNTWVMCLPAKRIVSVSIEPCNQV